MNRAFVFSLPSSSCEEWGEGDWQRPTFARPGCRTIIGAAAFHFRVRNGNGWGHCARITRSLTNLKLNSASSSGGEGEDRNRTSNSPDFYRPWRCQALIGASHRGRQRLWSLRLSLLLPKSKNRADSLTSTYRWFENTLTLCFRLLKT